MADTQVTTAGEDILVVEEVTKVFPGVVANDAVSVNIRRGEIHCLLGENGAGKTTLADILYGVYRAEEGRILLNGEPLELTSPRDAIESGIGMVHQHFELVPPMSVIENVVIGTGAKQWLDLSAARRRLEEFFSDYDVEIDPDAEVGRLSVGEQQWVEIFKTLYFGVEILILDEPTAVLTPQGVEELFRILRQMRDEGPHHHLDHAQAQRGHGAVGPGDGAAPRPGGRHGQHRRRRPARPRPNDGRARGADTGRQSRARSR